MEYTRKDVCTLVRLHEQDFFGLERRYSVTLAAAQAREVSNNRNTPYPEKVLQALMNERLTDVDKWLLETPFAQNNPKQPIHGERAWLRFATGKPQAFRELKKQVVRGTPQLCYYDEIMPRFAASLKFGDIRRHQIWELLGIFDRQTFQSYKRSNKESQVELQVA